VFAVHIGKADEHISPIQKTAALHKAAGGKGPDSICI
jgi:hypothetical protein